MRDWFEGTSLFEGRRIRLEVAGDRIDTMEDLGPGDGVGPWLAPGLVDLQINGCADFDFNAPEPAPDLIPGATHHLLSLGITGYLPTVVTAPPAAIEASLRSIAVAVDHDPLVAATVLGVHLEGPFISPEAGARGAHDARYVTPPDWDLFCHWQEAAHGLIRIVTLSPEWPQSTSFIERCVSQGLIVGIGHTAARPEQIREAVAAGARLSTHLGNGSHQLLPRHPNYVWEQLASDDLWASLIADGVHLPSSVLKVMLRAKGDHAFLVSDAVASYSADPGEYRRSVGGRVRLTDDGRLTLAGSPELLAGSIHLLPTAIEHLVAECLAPLPLAWEMASIRPARLLGRETGLHPGAPADIVMFDWHEGTIVPRRVVKSGHVVFQPS